MNLLANGCLCLGCALLASALGAPAAVADNVFFSGELADQTCTLEPKDQTQLLDFEEVSIKELYRNGRTAGRAIVLNLLDCDSGASKTQVNATFSGQQSPVLEGFLQLNSGSPEGLVIGLETPALQPLPLGSPQAIGRVTADGKQTLTFLAYLKALPSALAERSIGKGALDAALTFTLSYD